MKEKFHIAGIKKILLTWHKHADLLDTADPARALYGPPPKTAAGERGWGLVDFFKQVSLFEFGMKPPRDNLHYRRGAG